MAGTYTRSTASLDLPRMGSEAIADTSAQVLLAWVLEHAQGDILTEMDCHFVPQRKSHNEDVRSEMSSVQIFIGGGGQIDESLKTLKQCIQDGRRESPARGKPEIPHDVVLFETEDSDSGQSTEVASEILTQFSTVLRCTFRSTGVMLTSHSHSVASVPAEILLKQICTTLGLLNSRPVAVTINELRAATPPDIEQLGRLRPGHHEVSRCCVHDMFRKTALEQPGSPAIDAWDGRLNFEELDHTSSRIAVSLSELGVGCEDVVPLLFEKSKWTVVTMLAVLKAGGAFLFLDPAHPVSRLRMLIDKVKAKFSITSTNLSDRVAVLERPIHLVSNLLSHTPKSTGPQQFHSAEPWNSAFLLFISGSTGEPKGVVTDHQGLRSGILKQAHRLGIERGSRVIQASLFSFAAAVVEMLFTVVAGGCVCIPSEQERMDNFPGAMNRLRVTLGIFPPSYTVITDPTVFKTLEIAVVGSEALNSKAATEWSKHLEVRHAYGASEINTINTAASLNGENVNFKSIGQGVAHNFWIVDAEDSSRLMRIGYAGELFVEGAAIARGYLDDPEQTSKVFVDPPEWYLKIRGKALDGTRFYKTGDLARMTTVGDIEILGRVDQMQVKLRGQRIELVEVESQSRKALSAGSQAFAELVLPASSMRPALTFFLVVDSSHLGSARSVEDGFIGSEDVSSELTRQLKVLKAGLDSVWQEHLPVFMRPTCIIPLKDVPRLATGKVGRKLMRNWAAKFTMQELQVYMGDETSGDSDEPPSGELQEGLARIWSQIFAVPVEHVRRTSDFFALGGDSLGAIKIVELARDSGMSLTVADVMQNHSFAAMAQQISQLKLSPNISDHTLDDDPQPLNDEISQSIGIDKNNIVDVLPTTDSQGRAIVLGTSGHGYLVYHFVISVEPGVSSDRLELALQRVVERYDALRTLYSERNGEVLQVILRHIKAPIGCIGEQLEAARDATICEICDSGVATGEVPSKFWMFPRDGMVFKLVVRLSHAQFDGISLPLFWKALSRIWDGEELPAAPQYSRYAREVAVSKSEDAIRFFKRLLDPVPSTDLIKHGKPGSHPQNRLLRKTFDLPNLPYTPAIIFEAAWAFVLHHESREADVAFDHIASGRQHSSVRTSELFGACLNDVPVCVHFDDAMTVRELLDQISSQHLEGARFETLGFKSILGLCTPDHWPRDARMTSSVQCRGFDKVNSFMLGESSCTIEMVERAMDLEDLTILVTPSTSKATRAFDVVFATSEITVPETDADRYFELFSSTLLRFSHNLDRPVKE